MYIYIYIYKYKYISVYIYVYILYLRIYNNKYQKSTFLIIYNSQFIEIFNPCSLLHFSTK